MKVKQIIGGILLIILTNRVAYANSVFSFDGFPVQYYGMDVYGLGMGETGIGDTYRQNTGFINPSLSTTINQVYLSTAISTGNYYFKDEKSRFRTDGVNFPYFNIVVPLSNHRLGFNYNSYLSGNADVYGRSKQWENGIFADVNKIRSYLYRGSFIYAYKNRITNVGFSLDYVLGHRYRSWEQVFRRVAPFENPKYEYNETFKNFGFTLGFNKSIGNLSFGGLYRAPIELVGKTELATRIDTVFALGDSKLDTPHHIGLGATMKAIDIFKLSSDVNYELWSETAYYEDPRDTYKISLGLAYEPLWGTEGWYKKIPLRIGGYYRTLPFKANDSYLDEYAATFGFSIPLQAPNSQLDFSLKYLIRGNTDDHKYSDEGIILTVSISGFDFFRSRRKRTEDRDIPKAEFESYPY